MDGEKDAAAALASGQSAVGWAGGLRFGPRDTNRRSKLDDVATVTIPVTRTIPVVFPHSPAIESPGDLNLFVETLLAIRRHCDDRDRSLVDFLSGAAHSA